MMDVFRAEIAFASSPLASRFNAKFLNQFSVANPKQ